METKRRGEKKAEAGRRSKVSKAKATANVQERTGAS